MAVEAGKEMQVPAYAVMKDALYIHDDMVMIGPVFPKTVIERVPQFQPKEGDVLIAGYPKSGNFWTMEVVYHVCNSNDGVKPSTVDIMERVPMMDVFIPPIQMCGMDILAAKSSPRLMSSHLPGRYFDEILSKGLTKVVNIVRDPRDVMVSFYHFMQTVEPVSFKGTLADFYQHFKNSELPFGDYFRHVYEWKMMQLKYPDQVMVVTYDQMKRQPKETITQLAKFLGHHLTQAKIDKIAHVTHFDQMKNNDHTMPNHDAINKKKNHCRKGINGDWVNHFTTEMEIDFEQLVHKNTDYYNIPFTIAAN